MGPSLGIYGKILYGLQCFLSCSDFCTLNCHPLVVQMPWALTHPSAHWQLLQCVNGLPCWLFCITSAILLYDVSASPGEFHI